MKYTAKELKTSKVGEWAVFTGKKFFLHTVTKDKRIARERAIEMSMQFHEEEKMKLWEQLKKESFRNNRRQTNDGGVILTNDVMSEDGEVIEYNLGDFLC